MNTSKYNTIIKIILYWSVFIILLMGVFMIPPIFNERLMSPFFGSTGLLIALGVTFGILKYEKKTLSNIGINWCPGTISRFVSGLIISICLFGLIIFIILFLSPLKLEMVESPNFINAIGLSFVYFMGAAMMEEIIFRSYPLIRLKSKFGLRVSIYVTSIFFGLYHGLSFNSLIGPGVWGLIYGIIAVWSRGIAMPTGFHFGINWMQGFLGMKTERVDSIWEFVEIDKESLFTTAQVGINVQIILFIAAVILIEWYIRVKYDRSNEENAA